MEFQPQYWHWLIFGMLLMASEIFIPSFTIFWFGAAAVIIGLLAWISIEPGFEWQLLIWMMVSIAFAVAWFKWIKPLSVDRTMAGLSREAVIGERGMLTKTPSEEGGLGECRFPVPLLGSDTWRCSLMAPVKAGDPVIVKNILGNTLQVSPATEISSSADAQQI